MIIEEFLAEQWIETTISLSTDKSFNVVTNMAEPELLAASENWIARTDTYTASSLCKYINKKRNRGMTNHIAFPLQAYKDLTEEQIDNIYIPF